MVWTYQPSFIEIAIVLTEIAILNTDKGRTNFKKLNKKKISTGSTTQHTDRHTTITNIVVTYFFRENIFSWTNYFFRENIFSRTNNIVVGRGSVARMTTRWGKLASSPTKLPGIVDCRSDNSASRRSSNRPWTPISQPRSVGSICR